MSKCFYEMYCNNLFFNEDSSNTQTKKGINVDKSLKRKYLRKFKNTCNDKDASHKVYAITFF